MDDSSEFLQLITEFQGRLYGFILSLLADVDQANEVLQETNLVLWRQSSEFKIGTSFKAWSFRVAHFQVMAHRQRQIRDRLVFSEAVIEQLTRQATSHDELYESRLHRLLDCVAQLSDRNREVVRQFYDQGKSLAAIGKTLNRSGNATGQLLFRIRRSLIECVSETIKKIASDGV